MDWVTRMNRAIDYIEEHLTEEVDYAALAQITECSVSNFQRMFSFIVDEPLSEYIRNRRLTLAAFDIQQSGEKIVDLAFRYGYDSHDSFTRAFQRFHGVLPSQARKPGTRLKSRPRISFQITIKGDQQMNYQIEEWGPFTIMGFKQNVAVKQAFEVIPGIWQNAQRDGRMQRLFALWSQCDCRPAGLLGVCDGWNEEDQMDYYLAVTSCSAEAGQPAAKPKAALPEDMAALDFPAATWVIFNSDGPAPTLTQEVYKRFYTEWLPNSGYEPADLPAVECYLQDNHQEVWIAIVKK